jgi:hypothetical protein
VGQKKEKRATGQQASGKLNTEEGVTEQKGRGRSKRGKKIIRRSSVSAVLLSYLSWN